MIEDGYSASQRAALGRLAEERFAQVVRRLQSAASRFEAAEAARQEGDLETAARLYVRVAGGRVESPQRETAKQRLAEIAADGDAQWQQLRDRLEQLTATSSTPPADMADSKLPAEPAASRDDRIRAWFEEASAVAEKFAPVPRLGGRMAGELKSLRERTVYAAILYEPRAQGLLAVGQELEMQGATCCAVQAYQELQPWLPAPSAVAALKRLEILQQDPLVVEAEEACRNLQWCHRTYALAERVAQVQPAKARQLFAEVAARAPRDSRVYVAATDQLAGR